MKKQDGFPSALEQKTKELYLKLPRDITDTHISKVTGLSKGWICNFVKGRAKAPSVGRVEALYNFLSNKPLEL